MVWKKVIRLRIIGQDEISRFTVRTPEKKCQLVVSVPFEFQLLEKRPTLPVVTFKKPACSQKSGWFRVFDRFLFQLWQRRMLLLLHRE